MRFTQIVRRIAAGVLVAGTLATPAPALDRIPFDLAAVRSAQAEGDRFIIGAWADWCATCQAQIAALEALANDPRFAEVIIFEIDYDRQKPMMRLFQIDSRSQILAFIGEEELARLVAVVDPAEIEALLLLLIAD